MGKQESGDMGFQHRSNDGILNRPSSRMNTISPSDMSMHKSSKGTDPFLGSGWDPIVSLAHSENFGGSSMVPHNEFANLHYPGVLGNRPVYSSSHLVHYPSELGLVEMIPKLPCFGSGSFSEMVSSFGLPESGQITNTDCPSNYPQNDAGGTGMTSINEKHSQDDSPNGKRKRIASESHSPFNPIKNTEGDQQKDPSGDSSDENKQKIEANLCGKQTGKQIKDDSNSGLAPNENYLHMRAKRGQATNSHSLAERVRRERISERMRLLQDLVPGCNKITGKAVMLDEIINYVQSLQQQVEFLSMKLATVNPESNIDMDRILSKDILHSRGSNAAILGFNPGLTSSHTYPQGIQLGSLSSIPSTNPPFHAMPQNVWDNDLQSLLQMGFDSNPAINNVGPNGSSKLEL